MASFAIPLIGSGISALAGLFGNKNTKNETTVKQNLSPLQQKLSDSLAASAQGSTTDDLSAYRAQGLNSINDSFAPQDKALDNNIASRGLSFSPIAAALKNQNANSRITQQNQFQTQLPQIKRQWDQQQFSNLLSIFSSLPTSTTSTSTGQGSPLGGALAGAGAGLMAPYGDDGKSGLSSILSIFGLGKK